METKKCTKCGEVKNLSAFTKRTGYKNGVRSSCRDCENEYKRKWGKDNPEKRLISNRKYCKNNPEKVKEIRRVHHEKNRDKDRKRSITYYYNNKTKCLARGLEYRRNNPEKHRASNRRKVEKLTNAYIASVLGLALSECTIELIEAKRAQLQLTRATKD